MIGTWPTFSEALRNLKHPQIFLLSALLMACDELVLFFEVMCLTLPLVEFIFEMLVILPVEAELAPRLPVELFVVPTRLCFELVAETDWP